MKIQIDNRVVILKYISPEIHQSNSEIYHELNDQGVPFREHSFPNNISLRGDGSFLVNGHHYKTGKLVGEKCTGTIVVNGERIECTRCPQNI